MSQKKSGDSEERSAETEKHLKTVAKGAGLVFVGLVFSKILTYFYRLIIARYYGPGDYGLISIGLSVITVLITVFIFGMDSGIVRFVPEFKAKNDEKRVKGSLVTSIKITLPLSAAMAIFLWLLSPYLAGVFAKDAATQAGLTLIFQVFSLTLPFSVVYNLLLAASKGFQRIDYHVYTDNIFYSIVLVSSIALFSLIGLGISGIAWSYAITVIASFAFIFYFFNRHIFNLFSKTQAISETRIVLHYTIPIFIGSVATILIGSFDSIFLGIFKTTADVGLYNAALPTAKFITVFSAAFGALFLPIIIEYRTERRKEKEILTLYRTTTKWIFLAGFPFTLLLIFFSRNVLNVLFGAEYASMPVITSLSILGLAYFIYSLLIISTSMLYALDKTKYAMLDIVLASLSSFFLNIILIPHYGILGAALATSTSILLVVLLDSIFAWKFSRMNPLDFRAIIKSVFAGLISMGLIMIIYRLLGLSASIIILIPLFVLFLVLYLVLLIAFRSFDKNDAFILKEIEKKLCIRIGFLRRFMK